MTSASAWLPGLPAGWSVGRVGHVADAWTSNVDKHSVEGEPAVRLCNYTDVYKNDAISAHLDFMKSTARLDQVERFRLRRGDTLITKDSETADDIGVPAFVEYQAPDLLCGYHLAIIRPRPASVAPKYLYWVMASQPTLRQWAILASGVTRVGIRSGDLNKATIPIPPLAEQQAIVDYLDRETAKIDMLIEEQQRLIEMLQERRIATIAEQLPEVDGTRLKGVATVQSGVTLSGESDPDDPEWPYLRVANVQVGRVELVELKTIRTPDTVARAAMLRAGDVLMTEGGDVDKLGRGALWAGDIEPMLHQNHIFAVRTAERLDPEYLVYWLDGPVARTYFRTTAKKTTNLAATNKWTLGNLPVACPPLSEQRRIAAFLDEQTSKIDKLMAETERFIELSEERRAALITAAVTGQIDVREAT